MFRLWFQSNIKTNRYNDKYNIEVIDYKQT